MAIFFFLPRRAPLVFAIYSQRLASSFELLARPTRNMRICEFAFALRRLFGLSMDPAAALWISNISQIRKLKPECGMTPSDAH